MFCHKPETAVEVFKPNCSGLPQTCPQPPESEARELKCTCPTVQCKWKQWSAWSATCGSATRTRSIETIKVHTFFYTVFSYPCCCRNGGSLFKHVLQVTLFRTIKPKSVSSTFFQHDIWWWFVKSPGSTPLWGLNGDVRPVRAWFVLNRISILSLFLKQGIFFWQMS